MIFTMCYISSYTEYCGHVYICTDVCVYMYMHTIVSVYICIGKYDVYVYIMMCTLTNDIDVIVEWEAWQPNRDASCVAFLSIYLSIYLSVYLSIYLLIYLYYDTHYTDICL